MKFPRITQKLAPLPQRNTADTTDNRQDTSTVNTRVSWNSFGWCPASIFKAREPSFTPIAILNSEIESAGAFKRLSIPQRLERIESTATDDTVIFNQIDVQRVDIRGIRQETSTAHTKAYRHSFGRSPAALSRA
jgi:hypothetical protein